MGQNINNNSKNKKINKNNNNVKNFIYKNIFNKNKI